MKAKDIRTLTTDQVLERGKQYEGELFSLRFQQVTGQLENTTHLRQVRKNIARIKTTLNGEELNKN